MQFIKYKEFGVSLSYRLNKERQFDNNNEDEIWVRLRVSRWGISQNLCKKIVDSREAVGCSVALIKWVAIDPYLILRNQKDKSQNDIKF